MQVRWVSLRLPHCGDFDLASGESHRDLAQCSSWASHAYTAELGKDEMPQVTRLTSRDPSRRQRAGILKAGSWSHRMRRLYWWLRCAVGLKAL
jgi:hypothetical protein